MHCMEMASRGQAVTAQRTGLHARLLELAQPLTAQNLKLEAPYPQDFSQSLAYLRSLC